MRVDCMHGYFKFTEESAGQISTFMSTFGVDLALAGDHFTFEDLVEAPDYSLPGGFFLGCPTIVAFEGEPWEVMRANGLVYDFSKGLVIPIVGVVQLIQLEASGNFFVTSGMIVPGSLTDEGKRVTDYSAFYLESRMNFKYSEIDYE
jgi:hypothetical protein